MPLLKIMFYGGLVFFGAIALYIGAVFFLANGLSGPITVSYPEGGRTVTETVTRESNASLYFRLQAMMGYGPAVLGALAMWFGIRFFRSQR